MKKILKTISRIYDISNNGFIYGMICMGIGMTVGLFNSPYLKGMQWWIAALAAVGIIGLCGVFNLIVNKPTEVYMQPKEDDPKKKVTVKDIIGFVVDAFFINILVIVIGLISYGISLLFNLQEFAAELVAIAVPANVMFWGAYFEWKKQKRKLKQQLATGTQSQEIAR